jgi:starch synthase
MKILFVASESDPFIKTGGLGDVVYSLPKYLNKIGVETRVVIPNYSDINDNFKAKMKFIKSFKVPMSWRSQYCGVLQYEENGVTYYFIDNEYYFKRQGIYGFYDDGERFSFFDRAVLTMLKEVDFKPDVIHCHDWHTGMVPVLYKNEFISDPFYRNIRITYTIHNLLFQGVFPPEVLGDLLNLTDNLYYNGSVEFYGCSSFMKGGINFSDKITTVSKSYAEEIQTPIYGEKLDGLLRYKNHELLGIVNGIDYTVYNPNTDKYIYKKYNLDTLSNKGENKLKLQEELGLTINNNIPMFAIVSRLARQKGINLLIQILDTLLEKNIQLVILGTGDKEYEEHLKNLQLRYPKKVSANICFNNGLAHKIYAASDIFLMPSLFEPCGLGQLIALRYGTIPIVRETGGLKDTVVSYNEFTHKGNGFSFEPYNSQDLLYTIERALYFYEDKETWNFIMKEAMESDNSWENSALKYKELYEELIEK